MDSDADTHAETHAETPADTHADTNADTPVLQALAHGKSMDIEQWPSLLSRLIPRLENIALHEFPRFPKRRPSPGRTQSPTLTCDSQNQTPTKEGLKENSSVSSLPAALRALLASITETLFLYFSKAPPHTIQRLAELLLSPRAHYRTLPSYLHALDRVVHVTSPVNIFPLPPALPDPCAISVLSNGGPVGGTDPLSISWSNSVSTAPGVSLVGSDEALGGALLTPITWLRNSDSFSPLEGEVMTQRSREIIEGPNGPGGVETVSVSINGV